MKHVHFDIEPAVEKILADFLATIAKGKTLAITDTDRKFVEAQERLADMFAAFVRWDMNEHNLGQDVEITAAAFGCVLGSCLWSFANNTRCEPVLVVNAVVDRALQTVLHYAGELEVTDVVVAKTEVTAAQSGRA